VDFAALNERVRPGSVAWHKRHHPDPAHQWLRNRIGNSVDQIQ
jgi:DNA-binding transcriptional LysR family regulator